MDDVVALRSETESGQVRYWMTWGRLFNAVDPAPLINAVSPHLHYSQQEGAIASVEVCHSPSAGLL